MKRSMYYHLVFLLGTIVTLQAQEGGTDERRSYYETRAREDAAYEQSLALDEDDASDFWEDQEQYEKDLKKRDRQAYKAYLRGKRDAYEAHYQHCDRHCHHGPHYYSHAAFYYHGYREYHYYPRPYSSGLRVGAGVVSPGLHIGL